MNGKRYPCPVCCIYYARDRDIIFTDDEFLCESNLYDEEECGFSGPANSSLKEIRELAEKRIESLKKAPF